MRAKCGFALLEVLIALLLLSVAGGALASLISQSVGAAERAREAERATASALALLDAVSLWPREDLDRHLGNRAQGSWRLEVSHPHPVLYHIRITDSTMSRELLRTTLYRPEHPYASP